MRRRRVLLGVSLLLFVLPSLAAQRGPAGSPPDAPDTPEAPDGSAAEPDLFEQTILADLETADLTELLDWADTLGVDTRGDRRTVEDRILGYYGLDRATLDAAAAPDPADTAPPGDATAEEEERPRGEPTLLRIDRARGSEFFTLEETEEEYLRLTGGVQLTLNEGETVHRIEAQEIVLNLSENVLSAQGGVRYFTERADGSEEFRGDTIVFQIDTWEGVFIHGITETRGDDREDVEFSVSGERITRSPDEIIVVDGGTITSSQADPPNYRIRARRIWVLAPGEWGLTNAVLYVGRVPMFYLPVFFLPGDRLFFHPAVGTRSREGAFIQTTTYIFGESEEPDPPISIMRLAETPDEADREIRGLFLRIPEEPTEPDPEGWSLKVMADVYSTLGGYAGVAGSLPNLGPVSTLDWRLGVGASRAIFNRNGLSTPWYIDETGTARQYWNTGWFFGRETPLRYESELTAALTLGSVSLSLDLLLLSDPEFRRDFATRSESMDWGFLLNTDDAATETTGSTVSSTTWEASAAWRPSVPDLLSPWISSARINAARTRLSWRTRDAASVPAPLDRDDVDAPPEEEFLYPDSLVLPDLEARVSGTLLDLPRSRPSDEGEDGTNDEEPTPRLRPPWDAEDEPEEETESIFRLPDRAPDLTGIPADGSGQFRVTYSLQPNLRFDRFTNSEDWDSGDDVALVWRYSTLQTRARGDLTTSAADRRRVVELSQSLSWEYRYQSVSFDAELPEAQQEQLERSAFQYRRTTLSQRTSLTTRPFGSVPRLDDSSIRYQLNSNLFRRDFDRIDEAGTPRFTERWASWTDDDVTTHQASLRLVWNFWNAAQQFTAAAELPPKNRAYRGDLRIRTGPVDTTISGGYRENDEGVWTPETLVQRHELSALDGDVAVQQRLEYDLEQPATVLARSSVTFRAATVALTGRRTGGYRFVPGSGWVGTDGADTFHWTDLTIGLDVDREVTAWRRRMALTLTADLGVDIDLQRYTNSSLLFDYGFSIGIYRFLDLQVTARTRNDLLYQYVAPLADEVGRPRRSFFVDLLDSLLLFDRQSREESFFKLESLDITAEHDLEDWVLSFTYSGRPELETVGSVQRYRWRSAFSVVLRWRSISELQREIEVDDGEVRFGDQSGP